MSWKSEKLMSLVAHTLVITVFMIFLGAGIGSLFNAPLLGAFIGLSQGGLYFLLGIVAIRELIRHRKASDYIKERSMASKKTNESRQS